MGSGPSTPEATSGHRLSDGGVADRNGAST